VDGDVFLASRHLKISQSSANLFFTAAAHDSSGTEGLLQKLNFKSLGTYFDHSFMSITDNSVALPLDTSIIQETISSGEQNWNVLTLPKESGTFALENWVTSNFTASSGGPYLPLAGGTLTGPITIEQNGDALNLRSTTNSTKPRITFSSDVPDDQVGFIEYSHSDTASYGSGESFVIGGNQTNITILADGKLMYKEGIYSKPATGTGAGTRKDSDWDTAYTHSQAAHAPSDAEANVQSDWNATSGDALILNKPTIPTDYGDHDGLYLPIGGGTLTGDLTIDNNIPRIDFKPDSSGGNVGGRIEMNENGNLWVNAQGGKDLWLNWYSPTSPSSKADLQVGDGNEGSSILTVQGTTRRVGINKTTPTQALDVLGNIVASGTVTASGGNSGNWNTAYGWGDHSAEGYLTSLPSHNHNYILATDDRDVKPNATSVGSTIKGIQPFFTSLEGMTGTSGSNYQDLLVLDTYSDLSGGNANAITLDKSDGSMRLWNAAHNATSWGTAKRVWTDADFTVAPTGTNTGDQDLSGYLLNTTDTFNGTLTIGGSINFGSSNGNINLSRGGWITFYEDGGSARHGIGSRSNSGGEADDIRINSYGAVYINLDSNNNNTSGADFAIGRHGDATGTISELFRVSGETGNVGIGLTNPTSGIHVNTSQSAARFISSQGTGLEVQGGGNSQPIASFKDTAASEKVTISSTGNVGIGTTSPGDKLEVVGNIILRQSLSNTETVYISTNARGAGTNDADLRLGNSGSGDVLTVHNASVGIGTTSPGYKLDVNGSLHSSNITLADGIYHEGDTNTYINFLTDTIQLATSGSPRLYINSSGNVGIGTTSPEAKLDIQGSGNALQIRRSVGYASIKAHSDSGGNLILDSNSTGAVFINNYVNRPVYIATGGGNVGIGTTSPLAKLDVSGYVNSSGGYSTSNTSRKYFWRTDNTGNSGNIWKKIGTYNSSGQGSRIMITATGTTSYGAGVKSGKMTIIAQVNNNNLLEGSFWQEGMAAQYGSVGFVSNGNTSHDIYYQVGSYAEYAYEAIISDGTFTADSSTVSTPSFTHQPERSWNVNSDLFVNSSGNVGIGTTSPSQKLYVAGNIAATGDIIAYASSDKRLKDNIKPIENALQKIESIGGYTFDWNDKQTTYEGSDIGVIAQEIEAIAPELVAERETGYKAVKYDKLVAILIESVKELSAKVKTLESKLQ